MAKELQRGDRVEWNFGRGKAVGTVQRKLTAPTTIGGQKVAASPADPRYVVKTERSGKEAAKKAQTLRRIGARRGRQ
jgi:Hypervirulence associated proteins TUDOR domain